jgi:acetyl esterase/lipase
MLNSHSGGPASFRLLPALRYASVPALTATPAPGVTPPPGDESRTAFPAAETALHLDLLLPDPAPAEPVPVVIYLHGGGWRSGQRSEAMYPWLNTLLAAHGFATAAVTYRLTDQAPFPAQIHDVKAAVRWLRAHARTYGLDPDRIGVWGDSAGGQLASLLGVTAGLPELEGAGGNPDQSTAVQAVVARCASSDLERMAARRAPEDPVMTALFGGPPAERKDLVRLAGPRHHLRPGGSYPPFLLVHGTRDERADVAEQAEEFADALRDHGVDVTLHLVEGGHHNMREDPNLPWSDVPWTELGHLALAFFTKHLR